MERLLSVSQRAGNQARDLCFTEAINKRIAVCSHLATVQDYQVGAIHHDLKGSMAEQPELNKWKRYNVACLFFKKDLAIGEVCVSLEQSLCRFGWRK